MHRKFGTDEIDRSRFLVNGYSFSLQSIFFHAKQKKKHHVVILIQLALYVLYLGAGRRSLCAAMRHLESGLRSPIEPTGPTFTLVSNNLGQKGRRSLRLFLEAGGEFTSRLAGDCAEKLGRAKRWLSI